MNGYIVGAIIDRPRETNGLPYEQTVIMFADRRYSASLMHAGLTPSG